MTTKPIDTAAAAFEQASGIMEACRQAGCELEKKRGVGPAIIGTAYVAVGLEYLRRVHTPDELGKFIEGAAAMERNRGKTLD